MVLDAMRVRWNDPNANRNGRRGQRQDGVDVFGRSGAEQVGAQAKNSDTISEQTLLDEVGKAEQFQPSLDRYFVVVGGPRDAGLQRQVRVISGAREASGRFPVDVLFFEDVCHELSSRSDLVQKYWGPFLALIPALGGALSGPQPVLDEYAAGELIWQMPEFKDFAKRVEEGSKDDPDGPSHAHMRVEGVPDLGAIRGSIDRCWRVAIGESHPTHLVTLYRAAIDVDSGGVSIIDPVTDELIPFADWLGQSLDNV